jgi:hypothetical protein
MVTVTLTGCQCGGPVRDADVAQKISPGRSKIFGMPWDAELDLLQQR